MIHQSLDASIIYIQGEDYEWYGRCIYQEKITDNLLQKVRETWLHQYVYILQIYIYKQ